MHFYQWHVGDYLTHTRHLTKMEDLAFRRMLDLYYTRERPFNGSSSDVARLIDMRDDVAAVEAVLAEFFTRDGDEWRNSRADEEIAAYQDKVSKAQAAGRLSGQARRAKAERPLNGRATNPELPSTMNHEPVPRNHQMDGWMDGGSRTGNQKGEGGSTPVPPDPQPTPEAEARDPAKVKAINDMLAKAKAGIRGAGL